MCCGKTCKASAHVIAHKTNSDTVNLYSENIGDQFRDILNCRQKQMSVKQCLVKPGDSEVSEIYKVMSRGLSGKLP